MIPIKIIHYPPLKDRRKYLEEILPEAEWITAWRREDLREQHLSMYHECKHLWENKVKGLYRESPNFFELNSGVISCSVGHIKTLEEAGKSDSPTIILEDDALILTDKFNEEINTIMQNQPPGWDVIFLGGAFNHHQLSATLASIPMNKEMNRGYYLKDHPASNTVCAYMVTPRAAKTLSKKMQKFTLPIDFEMNYWMKESNMKVYHVSPYLIREGTSLGHYKTSQVRES